eukprot:6741835-Pyramimonas_sp.AAC.1
MYNTPPRRRPRSSKTSWIEKQTAAGNAYAQDSEKKIDGRRASIHKGIWVLSNRAPQKRHMTTHVVNHPSQFSGWQVPKQLDTLRMGRNLP